MNTRRTPRSDIFAIAERLIAENTVSDRSNLKFLSIVEEYLSPLGFNLIYLHNDEKTKASLLATIGPLEDDVLILCGHTDTVPFEGQPGWTKPPLKLTIDGGKLFGRGTADMKVFIAQSLQAFRECDLGSLSTGLALLLTYDEELGCAGASGFAKWLSDHGELLPKNKSTMIGEPTGYEIFRGHKGFVIFEVIVHGKGGHSSRPDFGVNAIVWAAKTIELIEGSAREIEKLKSRDPIFKESPNTTVSIASVNGGLADNMIPELVTIRISYRPLPEQNPLHFYDLVKKRIETELTPELDALDRGCSIETILRYEGVSMQTSVGTKLEKILCDVTGNGPAMAASYATDGGHLNLAGLNCLICGPGSIAQAHQPDEYIGLDDFNSGTEFIKKVIENFCR